MENTEPPTHTNPTDAPPSEVSRSVQPGKMVHLIPKNCIKNSALIVHVSKEPKYVPYEPYKAAVKPRMPCLKQKKTKVPGKKRDNKGSLGLESVHKAVPETQAADKEVEVTARLGEEIKLLNISDNPLDISDCPVS